MVSWVDVGVGAIVGFTIATWLAWRDYAALSQKYEELLDEYCERELLNPRPASGARDADDRPAA